MNQNKTSPRCTASGVTMLEERQASCRVSRRHFAVKLFYLWRIGSDNGCVQLLRLAARCGGAKCAGERAHAMLMLCSSSSSSFVSTQGPERGHEAHGAHGAHVEAFQVPGGLTTAGAAASDEGVNISRMASWQGSLEEGRRECMRAGTAPERSPSK
jgi:hypothetical protein